jgi:hypothetical protein
MAETQDKEVVVQGHDLVTTESTPAADPAYNPANPATRQTPYDNAPDGKSKTISVTYNPGPGDPDETEVFGKKVVAGEAVDIDARHAHKVAGNPYLSADGDEKKVPEEREPEEIEETTFDENVANERAKEYLDNPRQFASLAPGEAERIARAQQAAAELKAAQESDDKDKPKRGRGRPRKEADQVT